MAQQTGRQYDDDLTIGAGEYNESFSAGDVDLFEPLSDEDSPIAKLKTIVLSIDWEITDDILQQLHDELQDLKDVWAGNKINLVYIQALEKVGQYISAEKARSHPNAIKLLLTFYSNLERIVSSASISEEEKKRLLLQDVKRFEQFKIQIAPASKEKSMAAESPVVRAQVVAPAVAISLPSSQEQKNILTNLKAMVLSIDWEITDNALIRLSEEVSKLEKVFSENRAKLIFLQGIGALGNYIRSKKSNTHPDAFKLLHSFYKGLERTCNEVLSGEQEKEILLAEVKKFNDFKSVIATVASEVVVPVDDSASLAGKEEEEEEEEEEEGGFVGPAFADMPEGVRGFREDAEAVKSDVDNSVASFLGEKEAVADQSVAAEGPEVGSRLDALFGNMEEPELTGDEVSADLALSGVDVETEADDDSEEQALPFHGGALAPALAETSDQSIYAEVFSEKSPLTSSFADIPVVQGLEVETTEADDESEEQALPFHGGALAETSGQSLSAEEVSSEKSPVTSLFADTPVVSGVDVETEADDESDEESLLYEEGVVAPALAFSDETSGFREEFVADTDEEELDLEDRLDSFFGAEIEEASQGRAFHVPDEVHEEVSAVETSPGPGGLAEEQKISIAEPSPAIEEVEPTIADVEDQLDSFFGAEIETQDQGRAFHVPDEVHEEVSAVETSPEPGGPAGEQKISIAEPSPAIEEVEPTLAADVLFERESAVLSPEARSERLAVVFEPVGDDVTVDELPFELGGVGTIDDERIREQDSLARLQECVASIFSRKYEAFPAFFVEIDRLRQGWQAQHAKNTFLQLLLAVGKYIDTYRTVADAEALILLQSLCDKLEQVCQGKMGRDAGREQMLFEEIGTVLRWQQRLIATLMARHEGEDASFEVADDLTDIFSEK